MKYIKLLPNLSISEIAYSTIVYYAVKEVEGVFISSDKKTLTAKTLNKIVQLEVSNENIVININVGMLYEYDIDEVCKNVQNSVYRVISSSVGFDPTRVNVNVTNIVKL